MLPNETTVFERQNGPYVLSTDRSRLDTNYILRFLTEVSSWGKRTTVASLERSIKGSVVFGIYLGNQQQQQQQIGFARVVTDFSVLAYLLDVFIDPAYQGKGLGTWLSRTVREHPDLASVRIWRLYTLDAHGVYERAGWTALRHPEGMMEHVQAS